jgi:hypothetical protein
MNNHHKIQIGKVITRESISNPDGKLYHILGFNPISGHVNKLIISNRFISGTPGEVVRVGDKTHVISSISYVNGITRYTSTENLDFINPTFIKQKTNPKENDYYFYTEDELGYGDLLKRIKSRDLIRYIDEYLFTRDVPLEPIRVQALKLYPHSSLVKNTDEVLTQSEKFPLYLLFK